MYKLCIHTKKALPKKLTKLLGLSRKTYIISDSRYAGKYNAHCIKITKKSTATELVAKIKALKLSGIKVTLSKWTAKDQKEANLMLSMDRIYAKVKRSSTRKRKKLRGR